MRPTTPYVYPPQEGILSKRLNTSLSKRVMLANGQTNRYIHHNTSHPFRGEVNIKML